MNVVAPKSLGVVLLVTATDQSKTKSLQIYDLCLVVHQ